MTRTQAIDLCRDVDEARSLVSVLMAGAEGDEVDGKTSKEMLVLMAIDDLMRRVFVVAARYVKETR